MTSSYSHCSDCGSWVMDREFVGRGSWVVYRRVGFAVRMAWYGAGLRVLGSAMEWLCFWCWVVGSGFGDGVVVLCGAGLRVAVADGVIWCWVRQWRLERQRWGSAMEIGETEMRDERQRREREIKYYSLRPIFFAPFEKSNFLREHHLLFYLSFKNV